MLPALKLGPLFPGLKLARRTRRDIPILRTATIPLASPIAFVLRVETISAMGIDHTLVPADRWVVPVVSTVWRELETILRFSISTLVIVFVRQNVSMALAGDGRQDCTLTLHAGQIGETSRPRSKNAGLSADVDVRRSLCAPP